MSEGYIVRDYHIREKSCFGCDHYLHKLQRTGRKPEYRNVCKHPVAVKEAYGKFATIERYEEGLTIPGENAPEWCPVGERKE